MSIIEVDHLTNIETQDKDPRDQEIRAMLVETMHANVNRPGGRQVVLYSSRALDNAGSRFDFDVGVVGEAPLPLEDFFAFEDMLDELRTLCRIDWVDFARFSERYCTQALQKLGVIYE